MGGGGEIKGGIRGLRQDGHVRRVGLLYGSLALGFNVDSRIYRIVIARRG